MSEKVAAKKEDVISFLLSLEKTRDICAVYPHFKVADKDFCDALLALLDEEEVFSDYKNKTVRNKLKRLDKVIMKGTSLRSNPFTFVLFFSLAYLNVEL